MKKMTLSEFRKYIISEVNKLYKTEILKEENYPSSDTPIDELIAKFKKFNEIESDVEAVSEYVKLADLRMREAFADDMEYHVNLWQRRLNAAKIKLAQLENNLK